MVHYAGIGSKFKKFMSSRPSSIRTWENWYNLADLMATAIKFYRTADIYGFLSNFKQSPFVDDYGRSWRTVEHYFQGAKFFKTDPVHAEAIRARPSPMIVKNMGNSRKHPIDPEWETIKDTVMLTALRWKFNTVDMAKLLLNTDSAILIEDSPTDYYWGCGKDGSGQNKLGQLLMKVRDELKFDLLWMAFKGYGEVDGKIGWKIDLILHI